MKETKQLNIVLYTEGKYVVAHCLNNHVSSFGNTKKEALKNINEALELYFEDQPKDSFQTIESPEIIQQSFSYA